MKDSNTSMESGFLSKVHSFFTREEMLPTWEMDFVQGESKLCMQLSAVVVHHKSRFGVLVHIGKPSLSISLASNSVSICWLLTEFSPSCLSSSCQEHIFTFGPPIPYLLSPCPIPICSGLIQQMLVGDLSHAGSIPNRQAIWVLIWEDEMFLSSGSWEMRISAD